MGSIGSDIGIIVIESVRPPGQNGQSGQDGRIVM